MQEIWVWSLGMEDTLEKEMAIHSSILAWRIPWTEEPGEGSRRCREGGPTIHGLKKITEWDDKFLKSNLVVGS